MKLSIDRLRKRDGFMLLTPTFLQQLRWSASSSRRLAYQPCGGGTDTYEKAMQDERGREDGLHPTGGNGLEMTHAFEPAPRTLLLHPALTRSGGHRAEVRSMRSLRPYR